MRIGAGAANGMDYLLAWNGTHIANAAIRGKIEHTCRGAGLQPPIICTPEELMGESKQQLGFINPTRRHRMGRIRQMINVNGQECWTLFDTGARNTYVVPAVAALLTTSKLQKPFRSALGGEVKQTTETALLEAEVEGRRVSTHAMVIAEIGNDENGTPIEILFGALAMQQWGIRLIPEQEKLDLTHYPEEFVEF